MEHRCRGLGRCAEQPAAALALGPQERSDGLDLLCGPQARHHGKQKRERQVAAPLAFARRARKLAGRLCSPGYLSRSTASK